MQAPLQRWRDLARDALIAFVCGIEFFVAVEARGACSFPFASC